MKTLHCFVNINRTVYNITVRRGKASYASYVYVRVRVDLILYKFKTKQQAYRFRSDKSKNFNSYVDLIAKNGRRNAGFKLEHEKLKS